jgi:hypothetical protein
LGIRNIRFFVVTLGLDFGQRSGVATAGIWWQMLKLKFLFYSLLVLPYKLKFYSTNFVTLATPLGQS